MRQSIYRLQLRVAGQVDSVYKTRNTHPADTELMYMSTYVLMYIQHVSFIQLALFGQKNSAWCVNNDQYLTIKNLNLLYCHLNVISNQNSPSQWSKTSGSLWGHMVNIHILVIVKTLNISCARFVTDTVSSMREEHIIHIRMSRWHRNDARDDESRMKSDRAKSSRECKHTSYKINAQKKSFVYCHANESAFKMAVV